MCVSLDLRYIWSNEVYINVAYDHTKSSKVTCISSMQVYMKYMVILILYSTAVIF